MLKASSTKALSVSIHLDSKIPIDLYKYKKSLNSSNKCFLKYKMKWIKQLFVKVDLQMKMVKYNSALNEEQIWIQWILENWRSQEW